MGAHFILICHDCKKWEDVGKIYNPESTNYKNTFSDDELIPLTNFLHDHYRHRIESITEHDQDFIDDNGTWQYKGTVFK